MIGAFSTIAPLMEWLSNPTAPQRAVLGMDS
jgi:hypothetical protein